MTGSHAHGRKKGYNYSIPALQLELAVKIFYNLIQRNKGEVANGTHAA
jgi:hypothetical protein